MHNITPERFLLSVYAFTSLFLAEKVALLNCLHSTCSRKRTQTKINWGWLIWALVERKENSVVSFTT